MDPVTLALGNNYTNQRIAPAYALGYNPAIDIVYESGYREALKDKGTVDVYANDIKTDSDHSWVAMEGDSGSVPTLRYVDGVLTATAAGSGSIRRGWSRIDGFMAVYPYIAVRYLSPGSNVRYTYVKYIDDDNHLFIQTSSLYVHVTTTIAGISTNIASFWTNSSTSPSGYGVTTELKASIRQVHANLSASQYVLWLQMDGGLLNELVPISVESWNALSAPGSVGFGAQSNGYLYSLRAGYAQGGE